MLMLQSSPDEFASPQVSSIPFPHPQPPPLLVMHHVVMIASGHHYPVNGRLLVLVAASPMV
jgi:hypothetical protein